ncbi:hypothetical protein OHA02_51195 [Streptomyces phaeochromogenes]|nr:hypothetical protein [Streptomyces phaeochromogenes]
MNYIEIGVNVSLFGLSRMPKRTESPPVLDAVTHHRIGVFIPEAGPAIIDGKPFYAGREEMQDAVLNFLHHHAATQERAVEAVILDSTTRCLFGLSFAPDGSSQIRSSLRYPASSRPSHAPVPTADVDEKVVFPPTWRIIRSEPAPKHGDPVTAHAPIPASLATHVRGIVERLESEQVNYARKDIRTLREQLESERGASHPYTLEARALEAYAAYLIGDYRNAITLSLGVSRIRCGQRDPRAVEDATRASAILLRLPERQAVITHGLELTHMWARLAEKNQLSDWHLGLMENIERRLYSVCADSLSSGQTLLEHNTELLSS